MGRPPIPNNEIGFLLGLWEKHLFGWAGPLGFHNQDAGKAAHRQDRLTPERDGDRLVLGQGRLERDDLGQRAWRSLGTKKLDDQVFALALERLFS